MLSTIGSFGAWSGYPVGTVVEYACDERGRPVFAFSALSSHTPDITADPRCPPRRAKEQTTGSQRGSQMCCQGMADARVTLTGQVSALSGGDLDSAKAVFKAKNPGMDLTPSHDRISCGCRPDVPCMVPLQSPSGWTLGTSPSLQWTKSSQPASSAALAALSRQALLLCHSPPPA